MDVYALVSFQAPTAHGLSEDIKSLLKMSVGTTTSPGDGNPPLQLRNHETMHDSMTAVLLTDLK